MRSERLDKSWSTRIASSSTSSAAAAAAQKLPSWATVVTPHRAIRDTIGKEPLGLRNEESYLRTACYHATRRFIEQTQHDSMTVLLDPFHVELSRLLRQVAPSEPPLTQHPPSSSSAEVTPNNNTNRSSDGRDDNDEPPTSSAAKRRRISSKSDDGNDDDDTPAVANNADTSQQWCFRVGIQPSDQHRYDPLLLPVLLLDGPHYALDRQAWMRHLVVSTRVRRERTCVVWLTFQTTTDGSTASSSFMGKGKTTQRQPGGALHYCCREITRQCLQQDPDSLLSQRTGKSILLAKKTKTNQHQHPSMTSFTDMLVTWASRTTEYDEIVVCVDVTAADMDLNGAEVQDLLHWVAERRALHGLPFAVALLGPHSGKPSLELRSSAQGPAGVLVRRLTLPSATTLLDTFWTQLMKLGDTHQQQSSSASPDVAFPIHFATSFTDAVEQTYWQQNGSAIEIIVQLKQYLAHCFTRRGSAMLLYDTPLLPRQEQCRLTWFLLDKQARQLITTTADDEDNDVPSYADTIETLQDLQIAREKARIAMEVRRHIGEQVRRQNQEGPLLFTYSLHRLQQLSDIPLEKHHTKNQISFLAQLRARTVHATKNRSNNDNDALTTIPGKKINAATVNEAVIQYINELIVLAAHCAHVSELEKITQLTINDWSDRVNRLVKGNAAATAASVAAVKVQPRRQIIRGLLSQRQQQSSTPVDAAGQLYRLLQDRVSIGQEEWIALFRESSFAIGLADSTTQEILALFVYGIHHLMFQGLIREKRVHSSRADPVYEKTVLVWCTGD